MKKKIIENVAIIIVNWKQYELTKKCIESIYNSNAINFNIILVDNEFQIEPLTELKNEFKQIKFFKNISNLGFAAANNIGIKYAIANNYDFVLLLNNDTEVEKGFLQPLINCLRRNNRWGAVQPVIMEYNRRKKVWNSGGYLNDFFGLPYTNKKLNLKINEVDWITGCCILIKTSLVEKVGLLDENFFAYFEDVDWSIRMQKLGFRLGLVENSIVYHHGSKSLSNSVSEGVLSPLIHYLNIKNHIYLVKKHKNKFNLFGVCVFQISKFLTYVIYFTIRLRFKKLRTVCEGFVDGINKKVN